MFSEMAVGLERGQQQAEFNTEKILKKRTAIPACPSSRKPRAAMQWTNCDNTATNVLYLDTDGTTGLPFDTQTGQRFGELTANCV